MEKSGFSETQFVIAYLREKLNYLYGRWARHPFEYFFEWFMPSTVAESQDASDFIMKVASKNYSYSVFYQFKRSHLYNSQVFTDKISGVQIDTGSVNHHGFKIYNKSTTQQFNRLQQLARLPKNEVFYCAPLFHTATECTGHFRGNTVMQNSKLINFSHPSIQALTIPVNSSHKVIFNRTNTYVCSDITDVMGHIASEKEEQMQKQYDEAESNSEKNESDFNETVNLIRKILSSENEQSEDIKTTNILLLRERLAVECNIIWIPHFRNYHG